MTQGHVSGPARRSRSRRSVILAIVTGAVMVGGGAVVAVNAYAAEQDLSDEAAVKACGGDFSGIPGSDTVLGGHFSVKDCKFVVNARGPVSRVRSAPKGQPS